MVGPAYNLRYIPAREDLDHIGVFEDREHPQRKAVEDIPTGCVLVMDCRGDGEGVMVIPRHLAVQVAEEAVEQERFEDFVMDYVRQGESIFGLYPPDDDALARYQASKKSTSGQVN